MDILDWIQKAEQFSPEDFLAGFSDAITSDDNAVDIQREQWVKDGDDAHGNTIGVYKKSTEEITMGLKKAGDPWNLRNTGDFWERTYLNAVVKGKDLEFIYNSSGINKNELFATIRQYGLIKNPDDIFGLAKPYQEPFIRIIEPKFINQLENYYHV